MPLYVCASGSTPLAAILIAKGVSPGAAIAFLLTGPATNVTTFGVLARLHSRGTALLYAATTMLATIALGFAANAVLTSGASILPVHLHDHSAGPLEIGSALVLLALFIVSLLRQGTRSFVGQILSPHGAAAHEGHDHDGHDHGDGHGHAHGEHEHPAHEHVHAGGCCGSA
jgi:hypothetical protein